MLKNLFILILKLVDWSGNQQTSLTEPLKKKRLGAMGA